MSGPEDSTRATDGLLAALAELEVEHELGARPGEVVVTLPGERKLRTVASLVVGEHDVRVKAFVIRNPDENHEQVYRFLLTRNLRLPGLAYAIDSAGDVYLTGRLAIESLLPGSRPDARSDDGPPGDRPDARSDDGPVGVVDRLLGAILGACDEPFNELLVLGFLTSMRKEWAWRISRGESTANLEAFRHLLERPEADS